MNKRNLNNYNLNNKKINLINIDLKLLKIIKINLKNTNIYIKDCFDTAFEILRSGYSNKFINGPINKSNIFK